MAAPGPQPRLEEEESEKDRTAAPMITATDRAQNDHNLDSLRFYAYHGVGSERVVGNEFEVSVEIPPVYTDDLSATVS